MSGTPQAFLSYTRLDDLAHHGGITKLRAALELQVRAVTGDHGFWIFQDVDGIGLGENWPRLLDENLAVAPFLVPVLTPSFFRSNPCRDELRKFLAHEEACGRDNLVLPIYLVDTPVLEQPDLRDRDDLARAVARRQRWPWQSLALKSVADPAVRREVRKLAVAIHKRLEPQAYPPPLVEQFKPASPSAESHLSFPRAASAGQPVRAFRDVDAPWCPELVVIPAGSFRMGSPAAEEHRRDNEGPQREVRLARPFAIGRYTITRGQFASFVAATKHGLSGGAYAWTSQDWKLMADGDWRNPGFAQTDAHPVVCVSWLDAQAYVHWLAQRTGQPYRLPTEAEWEYAARAGTATPFWTGATLTTARASFNGNYAYGAREGIFSQGTVPVDEPSVPANPFGLHHVHGNVFEWVQDSYAASYQGAPINGHVSVDRKNGRERVLRGGSWIIYPRNLRSALRDGDAPGDRVNDLGFRVARTLTP